MQILPNLNFRRPVFLWNLMIRDTTRDDLFVETLRIYSSMINSAIHGNCYTFPLVVKACAKLCCLPDGRKLHSHIFQLGFQHDICVQTALIDMYANCSVLAWSRQVFDEMTVKNSVSWSSMISAYCREFRLNESIVLLKEMVNLGLTPSSTSFLALLPVCTLKQGLLVHCYAVKIGLCADVPLWNSVLSMYLRFCQINAACSVFSAIEAKSIVSWTTMVDGYLKVGDVSQAFKLFNQMLLQRVGLDSVACLNIISGCAQAGYLSLACSVHCLVLKSGLDNNEQIDNLFINMYANCGDLVCARRTFDMAVEKNVSHWTSMIRGYNLFGDPNEGVDLFKKLLETEIRPNEATLATVLSACADLGSLRLGKEIEEYILLNGLESNLCVQTSLIHMFCKCGSIEKAIAIFERLAIRDLAAWSSMINGYAIHGMAKEALSLFHKMQYEDKIMPDSVVYTGVLLACSHAGLVEDGLMYFKNMQTDLNIEPSIEHYSCLVDLLGRAGYVGLALETIQYMPAVKEQSQLWAPLLSSCRTHWNYELGTVVAKKLLFLEPERSGNYVSVANLYASYGKHREAAAARSLINERGLLKGPGWSQMEIGGSSHMFFSGGRFHRQSVDIYQKLEELNAMLLDPVCVPEIEMLSNCVGY